MRHNHYRKFLYFILSALILTLSLPTISYASSDNGKEYKFSDIDLVITVPSELICLTRTTTNNNAYLSKIGAEDAQDLKTLMITNNIYLEAIPEDISYEIAVYGKKASQELKNLNEITNSELKELFEQYIAAETAIDNEYLTETLNASEIQTINNIPYFVTDVTTMTKLRNVVYVKKFYTVVNGYIYSYAIQSDGKVINSSMTSLLSQILNSARYTPVRNSIMESGLFTELLSTIITIGTPIAILAVIFALINKVGNKNRAKLANEEAQLRAEYKKGKKNS